MTEDAAERTGEVATHRHTARHAVAFSSVELAIPQDGGWRAGRCRLLRRDGGATEFGCDVLDAISAGGEAFPVMVTGEADERHGPFDAEGLVTRFPNGADCYLFSRRADGLWEGVTVTAAWRGLAIVPHICDPG